MNQTWMGAFISLVLAASGAFGAGEPGAALSGVVRDEAGKTVPGATVVAQLQVRGDEGFGDRDEVRAVSDGQGRFAVTLPEGAMLMHMTVEGPPKSALRLASIDPTPLEADHALMAGAPVVLDVRLAAGRAALSGKVADAAGKPVKGAVVTIVRELPGRRVQSNASQSFSATTDAAGVYRFDALLSGSYGLQSVDAPRGSGLQSLPREWRLHGGERLVSGRVATHDVTLEAGGGIRGRVVDEAGKPVKGARVSASRAAAAIDGPKVYGRSGNFGDTAVTGADGRYAIEGLAGETYDVSAAPPEGSDFAPSGEVTGIVVAVGKDAAAQDILLVRGGTLSGVVKGADGKPVAGAVVRYSGRRATTDGRGRYRFANLATGVADLRVTPPKGSICASETLPAVPCVAKVDAVKDAALAQGASVQGAVTDGGGKPLQGALVYAMLNNARFAAMTDKDGKYRLVGLAKNSGVDYQGRPARWSLAVQPMGDSPCIGGSVQLDVNPPDALTQDFRLEAGASLRVTVAGPDGKPVAGAAISVYKEMGRGGTRSFYAGGMMGIGPSLVTGADGTLTVRRLPADKLDVSAEPPDGANLLTGEKRGVALRAGETAEAAIALRAGARIEGTLTDEKGAAVAEAEVSVEAKNRRAMAWGREQRPVTTDAKGHYEFAGLPSGGYTVSVQVFDESHVVAPAEVSAKEGETATADGQARPGAFIEVAVKGPADAPVASASVRADRRGAGGRTSGSTYGRMSKAGVATVGPLPAGDYDVQVQLYGGRTKRYKPAELKGLALKEGERVQREVTVEEDTTVRPEDLEQRKKDEMLGGSPPGG